MTKIEFDYNQQHFYLKGGEIEIPEHPLTVTLQITRRCDLRCIYCSESGYIPDPPEDKIKEMIKKSIWSE